MEYSLKRLLGLQAFKINGIETTDPNSSLPSLPEGELPTVPGATAAVPKYTATSNTNGLNTSASVPG